MCPGEGPEALTFASYDFPHSKLNSRGLANTTCPYYPYSVVCSRCHAYRLQHQNHKKQRAQHHLLGVANSELGYPNSETPKATYRTVGLRHGHWTKPIESYAN